MMDIQITGFKHQDERRVVVYRDLTLDDGTMVKGQPCLMFNETLAIRAGEYNTDADDPRILDMILLEHLIVLEDPYETHPLFALDTPDALEVVENRIEAVRIEHGAPEEPVMRQLFTAADDDRSTQGLTDVKKMFMGNVDKDTMMFARIQFEENRKAHWAERGSSRLSYAQELKARAMGTMHEQASEEDRMRNSRKR
jgi:hypothetical protein